MVLADPGLVVAQAVEPGDQLEVAAQRQRRVVPDPVEGGEEDAEAQAGMGHGDDAFPGAVWCFRRQARDVCRSRSTGRPTIRQGCASQVLAWRGRGSSPERYRAGRCATRSAADPPVSLRRGPASDSLPSSPTLRTAMSRSVMLPTKSVRPSGAKAAPCAQVPTFASETMERRIPSTFSSFPRPGPKKGEFAGLFEPFITV